MLPLGGSQHRSWQEPRDLSLVLTIRVTKASDHLPFFESCDDVDPRQEDGEKEVGPEVVSEEGSCRQTYRRADIARVPNPREDSVTQQHPTRFAGQLWYPEQGAEQQRATAATLDARTDEQ